MMQNDPKWTVTIDYTCIYIYYRSIDTNVPAFSFPKAPASAALRNRCTPAERQTTDLKLALSMENFLG